ncbi:MAG: hypothetical protein EOP84_08810 [Verrucomicrobiaceae bacterium]|nr:MAG: hypothetical protein EOP84_08810 [Verrucomicrobiaceae bacterium]
MKIGDQILLFDKTHNHVSTFVIDQVEPEFLGGVFSPTENFKTLQPLFERYADMVEGNSLAYVDEVTDEIDEFGIYGKKEGTRIDIFDIQIYGEHGSLRLQPFRAETIEAEQGVHGNTH